VHRTGALCAPRLRRCLQRSAHDTIRRIRDVPDAVHKTLKVRAAAEGISLSDYIKRDLE